MLKAPVDLARLKSVFDYNPESGAFTWKEVPFRSSVAVGTVAGGLIKNGYWGLTIDGRKIPAHRAAWFYCYGEWATGVVHINGDKTDNRIANLRVDASKARKAKRLTINHLHTVLSYDPETGVFTWVYTTCNRRQPGDEAGTIDALGYRTIGIGHERFLAHRLAWLYMTGEWPENQIDHINLDKGDNRWCNLRMATYADNNRNVRKRSDNTSGVKGVTWNRLNKNWRVVIHKDGRQFNVGSFKTIEEAEAAYEKASRELHGAFARHDGGASAATDKDKPS